MNRLGKHLKAARLKKGYSIEKVAEIYGIGGGHISQIENGIRLVPHIRILHKFAKAYWIPFEPLCTMARQGLKDKQGELEYVKLD